MKIFAFLAITVAVADTDGTLADESTILANQNQANVDGDAKPHAAGSCFTCNATGANTADTYANCHTTGQIRTCPTENSLEEGEKLCFMDVTKNKAGQVVGFNTGCKDRVVSINKGY